MTTEVNPFISSAKDLLQSRQLLINGLAHNIIEVEFYLHSPTHLDPYVHRHPQQLLSHTWYFHRAGNREDAAYKGGSFKGLDITMGDNKNQYYGILLRTIQHPDKDAISGPCKVVDYILHEYKVASISELTENKNLNILDNPRGLHLITPKTSMVTEIYAGPRILGKVSGGDPTKKQWADKSYRFCSQPKLVSKAKKSLVKL